MMLLNLQKQVLKIIGGKGGGGRKDFAQAGGQFKDKIDEAFEKIIIFNLIFVSTFHLKYLKID